MEFAALIGAVALFYIGFKVGSNGVPKDYEGVKNSWGNYLALIINQIQKGEEDAALESVRKLQTAIHEGKKPADYWEKIEQHFEGLIG